MSQQKMLWPPLTVDQCRLRAREKIDMKALILLKEKNCRWVRSFFPSRHPGMITLCNNSILEFMVDFAILSGCTEIRMVMDEPGMDVEQFFKSGSRWGARISYGNSMDGDTLGHILEKNHAFCKDTSLLILDGFFFINYDKSLDYSQLISLNEPGINLTCSTGSMFYVEDEAAVSSFTQDPVDCPECSISPLATLDDLLQISIRIMESEQNHYVLPGYGSEEGMVIGSNVEINPTARIIKPVILGNNVRILGETVVGPNATIGNNVIIDSGSQVEQSIIMDGSYVGHHLTIKQKIVEGQRVIDPRYQKTLTVEDGFLFSKMETNQSFSIVRTMINLLVGLCLAGVQLIPYILLGSIRKIQKDWSVKTTACFMDSQGTTRTFDMVHNNLTTCTGKIFAALSLDKFPLLGSVIKGKLRIVGNRLLEATPKNRKQLHDFPEYIPGAFFYSESDGFAPDSPEEEISERFYAVNRTVLKDAIMLLKALIARLT